MEGNLTNTRKNSSVYRVLVGNLKKEEVRNHKRRWGHNITINLQGRVGDSGLVLFDSEKERVAGCCEIGNEILNPMKSGFLD